MDVTDDAPGLALTALDPGRGGADGAEGADALPVHVVDNGDVRLAFLPTVGGRLISVRCGGAELLWRNPEYLDDALATVRPRATWPPLDGGMGSWPNLGGSKTWPAPQGWSGPGEWPGPPDGVLDSGEWAVEAAHAPGGALVVRLTSPDDPRTGLRVTRAFTVPARGRSFAQRTTFTNVCDRPVRWAVWEVAQVDTASGGELWVDVAGTAEPVDLVDAFGRVGVGPVDGGRRRVTIEDVVGKVGFTDATGALSFRRPDGAGLDWRLDVPDGVYPDGGCQVEIWMQYPTPKPLEGPGSLHPTARLLELEALTPLTDLAPGASVRQQIEWTAVPPA